MDAEGAVTLLRQLGVTAPQDALDALNEGSTSLIRSNLGATVALLRRADLYDCLLVSSQPDCPVLPLRDVLETAVLPLSEQYATQIGVALADRDALRKRIREAAIALDVIANGRVVSIHPPQFATHPDLARHVADGLTSVDHLPHTITDDLATLNQLQANIISWSKEVDRIVHTSNQGPGAMLTAEKETMFWTSLDAALSSAQDFMASPVVKLTLDVLARQRRATGFLIDVTNSLTDARRNATAVLTFIQGLPILALRTAEDLASLKEAVVALLAHVASKIRISSFSVERILSLVNSIADDVSHTIGRIMSAAQSILLLPFNMFVRMFEECCGLFEAWSHGFNNCRKVAREIARVQGQAMPPRTSSPLSRLAAHLSAIYELRTDFEALRTLSLSLAKSHSHNSQRVELLDATFSVLLNDSATINHFTMSDMDEARWEELLSAYRSSLEKVETQIAADYSELVSQSTDLRSLATAIQPFETVLDKNFMASAAEDAVQHILELGVKNLKVLRARRQCMDARATSGQCHDVPMVCVLISEGRLLQNRIADLLKFLEQTLGATRMNVIPDVRDFVADVVQMKKNVNPCSRFSKWLKGLNMSCFQSPLFVARTDNNRKPRLSLSISSDIAWLFRVVRVARAGSDTNSLLTPTHVDMSRMSNKILPICTDLSQSLKIYHSLLDGLRSLNPEVSERIYPLLRKDLDHIQSSLEEGFSLTWDSSKAPLRAYSSNLLNQCESASSSYCMAIESDSAICGSLIQLNNLAPTFGDSLLSASFLSCLRTAFKQVGATRKALTQRFSSKPAERYIEDHWVAKLESTLLAVISRLTAEFFNSFPQIFSRMFGASLRVTHPENETPVLLLNPGLAVVESLLYDALGKLYGSFCELVEDGLTLAGLPQNSAKRVCSSLVSRCVGSLDSTTSSPFERIANVYRGLIDGVKQWRDFAPFEDTETVRKLSVELVSIQVESNDFGRILDESYRLLTSVNELQTSNERLLGSGRDKFIRLDSEDISKSIISNLRNNLVSYSRHFATAATGLSQHLYKNITDASKCIQESSSSLDTTSLLVTLHDVDNDTLPNCRQSLDILTTLERKFEEFTKKSGNSFISVAEATETWIVSDGLRANLEKLTQLYELRKSVVDASRSKILDKFEDSKKEYQLRLASLFKDFNNIRGHECDAETYLATEDLLLDLEHQLHGLDSDGDWLQRVGAALGVLQHPDVDSPKDLLDELKRVREGMRGLSKVQEKISMLSSSFFRSLVPDAVESSLCGFVEEVDSITRQTGAKKEGQKLRERINTFLKQAPLLKALKTVRLSPPRERDILLRLFGNDFVKNGLANIPLRKFWDANLINHDKYLKNVFEVAAGEASVCDFLKGIENIWSARKCQFFRQEGIPLVYGIPAVCDEIEEALQGLETMKASKHAELFESERSMWEKRLSGVYSNLELLADVQSRWAHLKTLFNTKQAGSIGLFTELREEMMAFSNVHARFSSVCSRLEIAPGLVEVLEEQLGLEDMLAELRGIVRGLSKFLERQRVKFPRFFFLSDDDLLHVLSLTTSTVGELLPHAGKLFPGVNDIELVEDGIDVTMTRVRSPEGEYLSLPTPVGTVNRSVISVLIDLHTQIELALKEALQAAMKVVANVFSGNLKDVSEVYYLCEAQPVQMCSLAFRVCFTSAVEVFLSKEHDWADDIKVLHGRLQDCLDVICTDNTLSLSPTSKTASVSRVLTRARDHIIKELVFQRDLLVRLLKFKDDIDKVRNTWTREFRFYSNLSTDGRSIDVTAKCSDSEFDYGWEYLGVGEELVRTDLTTKCFVILSEALRRGFGGSPFGPAGTGKTETVKAMGRVLGRFVSVFNCDESFDAVAVGRILAGACRIGCWVCFDEFNRLSASSLSSTSGQLALLQDAVRKRESRVENFYEGELPIDLKHGFGIFVTMNPTYTGRRELPANLKTLFRPCAMSKPDYQPIAEVLLLSEGFRTSSTLSKKLVTMFDTLRAVLSEQPHYDFGLRSLKSAITACGTQLKSYDWNGNEDVEDNKKEESLVVIGIGEVLKPKLDSLDIPEYEQVVRTTFPNSFSLRPPIPDALERSLKSVIKDQGLAGDDTFWEKLSQFYSLLQHQSGVILVGGSGSGKSTVWRTLRSAWKQSLADQAAKATKLTRSSLTILDPKLLSTRELYGHLDPLTREWTDGLFTKTLRGIADDRVNDNGSPLHWIVFDGDVDPDWAENLNSVLDDNKILTLPSGEQVPLLSNTRIIFETTDLDHANPSTVSRCGMICFGGTSFVLPWLQKSVARVITEVTGLHVSLTFLERFSSVILASAISVANEQDPVLETSIHGIMKSFIFLTRHNLESLFAPRKSMDQKTAMVELDMSTVIRIILVSASTALCSALTHRNRSELSKMFVNSALRIDEVEKALQGVVLPSSLADVVIDSAGNFLEFRELLFSGQKRESTNMTGGPDDVIPTPTTLRIDHQLRASLQASSASASGIHPVVLCGPPGCGKSMLLTSALRETPNLSLVTLSFSSETSPQHILTALKGHTKVTKRPNGALVIHPKTAGCRVVLFCDEVNLEKPDRYGSQKSVAFLRSLTEHSGFWSGSPPVWTFMEGVHVVAACNPADHPGRHKLPIRLMRFCHIVRVEEPTAEDLNIIYGIFMKSLLKRTGRGLESKNTILTSAMVDFFSRNKDRFSPPGSGSLEPHYVYSPRDLSRWVRGMGTLLNNENTDDEASSMRESQWTDVVSAFCYEGRRIFRDRLIATDERLSVEQMLADVVRDHLTVELPRGEPLYTSWLSSEDDACSSFSVIEDAQKFRSLIYQKLRVFAEEQGLGGSWMGGVDVEKQDNSSAMIDQFAVTDDVLTHLTRIERILSQPLGHAVLMGAPGTGKKTLARFSAWMLSMEVHQVRSHSSYTEQDFAVDLRSILKRAGVQSHKVLLIFDESHAMESAFLEMMNSLLACGDVPGLFDGDERLSLIEALRLTSTHSANTEHSLYAEFIERVRTNLHIIFTISSYSRSNGILKRKYSSNNTMHTSDLSMRSPALYNRCTVDWIGDWNHETLEAVAELKIEVFRGSERDAITQCAVEIHGSAKEVVDESKSIASVTPRHYLEFIEQINRVALEKGGEIEAGVDRYTEGLHRLKQAGSAVDELKEALSEKTQRLHEKERVANETLEKMVEEQRLAEKAKFDAEQLAQAAAEASDAVQAREDEVAAQLADVGPKVEEARQAVGSIRKEYLEELRAMPNPPQQVRLALEGVLMLLDGSPKRGDGQITWGNIRSRMRGGDFIATVVSFDAESISKAVRAKLQKKVVENPDFDVEKIFYASRAAGPLAAWTLAVLEYVTVMESVEPLQDEVRSLQDEQQALVEQQEISTRDIVDLQDRIESCRRNYAQLVSEAERVRQDINESETNLGRAEEMLDSLDNEWGRWISEVNALNAAAVTLWGNAILSAAFLSYAGALDPSCRTTLGENWRALLSKHRISFEEKLVVSEYLTSAEERRVWSTLGLPLDSTSLENYAILKRSARFPLIVDPSRGSGDLLRTILSVPDGPDAPDGSVSKDGFKISESSFTLTGKKSYMRALESAMRFGASIVLDDAERFDRAVAPLLGQEISISDASKFSQSSKRNSHRMAGRDSRSAKLNVGQRAVRLGDKEVFVSPSFRLYLSTRNIRAVPKTAVTRANVVSFALSPAALGATCISRSMSVLAPDLEQKRKKALASTVQCERRKHILEEKVLSTINNVENLGTELLTGSLLNDLSTLKNDVLIIEKKQKEQETMSAEISKKEHSFEPLGAVAVDVFQVLQSLSAINEVYSFNTEYFLGLFERALSKFGRSAEANVPETVEGCKLILLQHTILHLLPSLFPRDRLCLAASIALISTMHLNKQSSSALSELASIRKSWRCSSEWVEGKTRDTDEKDIHTALQLLPKHLIDQAKPNPSIENDGLSKPIAVSIRVLRSSLYEPHSLPQAIDELISLIPNGPELVRDKVSGPEQALRSEMSAFVNSQAGMPRGSFGRYRPLLLCARGESCDPSTLVIEQANSVGASLLSLTTGSNLTENALTEAISIASQKCKAGGQVAVFVKNIHLAKWSLLQHLQAEVSRVQGQPSCLIIVTMEVSSEFSRSAVVSLSSLFRVLAFESPPSFKTNLSLAMDRVSELRSAGQVQSDEVENMLDKLQVAVGWLHACLLERARHAPIGFTEQYDFSDADLQAAWDSVVASYRTSASVKTATLRRVAVSLHAAAYGCRLERDTDADVMQALVDHLFSGTRLTCAASNAQVRVIDATETENAVAIPTDAEARDQYVRGLPLHAPPAWSRMPADTSRVAQRREGLNMLRKTLALSNRVFRAFEPDDDPATGNTVAAAAAAATKSRSDRGNEALHSLLELGNQLRDIASVAQDSPTRRRRRRSGGSNASSDPAVDTTSQSSLVRCLAGDAALVGKAASQIASDLAALRVPSGGGGPRGLQINSLRAELVDLARGGARALPSRWRRVGALYGGAALSADDLVNRLSEGARRLEAMRQDAEHELQDADGDALRQPVGMMLCVDLSAVVRARALFAALRYDVARAAKVSPHVLVPTIDGDAERAVGIATGVSPVRLDGVRVSGASWNGEKGVFELEECKAVARGLVLSWEREGERAREGVGTLTIPLYERGAGRRMVCNVLVAVSEECASEEWRLRGVCFAQV